MSEIIGYWSWIDHTSVTGLTGKFLMLFEIAEGQDREEATLAMGADIEEEAKALGATVVINLNYQIDPSQRNEYLHYINLFNYIEHAPDVWYKDYG